MAMDLDKLKHITSEFKEVGKPYLRRPIILDETLPKEVYEKVGEKIEGYSKPTEEFKEGEAMGENYWRGHWATSWDKLVEEKTTIEHNGETYTVYLKFKTYLNEATIKQREKTNKEMARRAEWTEEQWRATSERQQGQSQSQRPPRTKPRRDDAITGSHRKWKEDNTGYYVVAVFKDKKAVIRIDFRFVTTLRRPPEVEEPQIQMFDSPMTDEEMKDLDKWTEWYEDAKKYFESDEHKKYMKAWGAASKLFMM